MPEPAKKPPAKKQAAPKAEPLPDLKPDLVALAIGRGVPSYEAWDMTVEDLKKKLGG